VGEVIDSHDHSERKVYVLVSVWHSVASLLSIASILLYRHAAPKVCPPSFDQISQQEIHAAIQPVASFGRCYCSMLWRKISSRRRSSQHAEEGCRVTAVMRIMFECCQAVLFRAWCCLNQMVVMILPWQSIERRIVLFVCCSYGKENAVK